MKNDWNYCQDRLRDVSRTFSRPIELLRDPLEKAVTCGYLLCRIADTVEDADHLNLAQRDLLYDRFLDVLSGRAEADSFSRVFAAICPQDESPEADLACHLPRVMRVVHQLDTPVQQAIAAWVGEMTRGMAIYSHRRAGDDGYRALLTLTDLERYCYFVAGTVGHLLTDLFIHQLGWEQTRKAEELRAGAEEFGLGLQLVNILKDITDDREREWSFIPRSTCLTAGISLSELTDPALRVQAHAALAPIFERANEALDGAFDYCLNLPADATDIRLFCLLPLWMAVSTLRHARGNDNQFEHGKAVKITRAEVEQLIADCVQSAHDDAQLRLRFAQLKRGVTTPSLEPARSQSAA